MMITTKVGMMLRSIDFDFSFDARGQVVNEMLHGIIFKRITHSTRCMTYFHEVNLDRVCCLIAKTILMVLLDKFEGNRRPAGSSGTNSGK